MKLPKLKFAVLLPILAFAFALTAWAVQTPLTPITPLGPYVTGQPSATTLNFAFTACDASAGNSFPISGREVLLVENTSTTATFTISSAADALGRTNDVTAYSLGMGLFSAFNFRGGTVGWKQGDNTVHLACSNASILFAVITTPN